MGGKGGDCRGSDQIFNFLPAMGEVSEDWRTANVVPLFKKDCRDKLQTNESHVSGRETIRETSEGEHLSPLGEAKLDQGSSA